MQRGPAMSDVTPFVSRRSELARMRSHLDAAMAGLGRIVMIAGEPGIGKTRTAAELETYAEERGCHVLWGRCYEEAGAPPYWTWVQPIRSYVEAVDSDRLREEMREGALEISDIVPEVRGLVPDNLGSRLGEGPEQTRFRLFDAVSSFFVRASSRRPVLIVLDNLHWAHSSSLRLLNFLATTIVDQRILIVGTYRDEDIARGHPLIHALGDLNRLDHFDRLILRGLTSGDIADYIAEACGAHAHGRLAELIHLHTEGNSFFVTELVRLLQQEGVLHANAFDAETVLRDRVPAGVREVIGRRLDHLSEVCSRVLAIGSVIGREFSLEQLLALPPVTFDELGLPTDSSQIMDAVDEAIASHLIEEVGGHGDFRFVHALIQQALAAELTTTVKIRLHARIAETLERMQGNGTGTHLGELVRHFSEAEALIGSDKLVKYLILAGEQALSTYAYEEALGYFRQALAAKSESEPDDRLASILFGLGRAQVATAQRHEMQNAVETLTRAFDYYESTGDVETALQVAEYPVMATTGITGITHLIARALDLADPDSHRSGRLWGRYIRAAALERGEYGQANDAYLRAIEIARRERDIALEVHASADAGSVDGYYLELTQGLEKCLRAIDLAAHVRRPDLESTALNWAATILLVTGRPVRARHYAEACLANAEKLRDGYRIAGAIDNLEDLARLEGDWDLARELSDYGLRITPRDGRLLAFRAVLEYDAGVKDQGDAFFARLIEAIEGQEIGPTLLNTCAALCLPIITEITGMYGHSDIGRLAADRVIGSPEAAPGLLLSARAGRALTALSQKDVVIAETLYDRLLPHSGIMVYGGVTAVDRILGLLAGLTGRSDQANSHFTSAARLCHRAAYRPEYAWNAFNWASVLAGKYSEGSRPQERTPGNAEKALALLDEALDISQELGMGPLAAKSSDLLESIKGQLTHVAEYPDGLTRREVEVLRVLARGKTNPEIGEELFISLNTVTRHLSHIYTKTGAANRVEAAIYAANHGLVEEK